MLLVNSDKQAIYQNNDSRYSRLQKRNAKRDLRATECR